MCRLDAIGAIGIARCFTYGGHFKRVLHDPAVEPRSELTKQQYTDRAFNQTTINHFHEKLLKLKVLVIHPGNTTIASRCVYKPLTLMKGSALGSLIILAVFEAD